MLEGTPGRRQHPLRLIHRNQPLVLVQHLQHTECSVQTLFGRGRDSVVRVGLHLHPLEHVLKYRLALSPTGGVVQVVSSHLVGRGVAPPELRNCHRDIPTGEGVLEQFRSSAVPRPGGRAPQRGFVEHGQERSLLPACTEKHVPVEEPVLQLPRLRSPDVLQTLQTPLRLVNGDLGLFRFYFILQFQTFETPLNLRPLLFQPLVQRLVFRLVEHRLLLFPQGASFLLLCFGVCFRGGPFLLPRLLHCIEMIPPSPPFGIILYPFDRSCQLVQFCFSSLVEAIFSKSIVDWRAEPIFFTANFHCDGQRPRIGLEIS
mmetsp:Transcript_45081/g.95928  ORF Transcript_45081/g.95928 Transcript_45081/m.95928 type:complete len:315 (-) Transcript_45081:841-1785(-)